MADAEEAAPSPQREPLSTRDTRRSPARVKVYDEAKLVELLEPVPQQGSVRTAASSYLSRRRAQARREKKQDAREAEEKRVRRYAQHREISRRTQAKEERQAQGRKVDDANRRERRYRYLQSDIAAGHELADEVDKHLKLEDMNRRTKLKRQYDDWNSSVYGRIQDQINEQLDSTTVAKINARRRREYQKFLDATNAKGAIFRDIIIESEYDPLEPNRHCIKVDTFGLRDPLKRALDRHYEETATLDADSDGDSPKRKPLRPKPKHREVLDVRLWNSGKIEATPHGHFAKMMGGASQKESKTTFSRVPFDHFDVLTGPGSLKQEFPRGKKPHVVPTTIKLG